MHIINFNAHYKYAKTGAIAKRQCSSTQLVTKQTAVPLSANLFSVSTWHLKLFSEFGDLTSKSSVSRKKTFLISLKKKNVY